MQGNHPAQGVANGVAVKDQAYQHAGSPVVPLQMMTPERLEGRTMLVANHAGQGFSTTIPPSSSKYLQPPPQTVVTGQVAPPAHGPFEPTQDPGAMPPLSMGLPVKEVSEGASVNVPMLPVLHPVPSTSVTSDDAHDKKTQEQDPAKALVTLLREATSAKYPQVARSLQHCLLHNRKYLPVKLPVEAQDGMSAVEPERVEGSKAPVWQCRVTDMFTVENGSIELDREPVSEKGKCSPKASPGVGIEAPNRKRKHAVVELEDECEKLQEEFVDLSVRIEADGGALVNDNEEIIVVDAWEPSGVDGGKRDFIRKQSKWKRLRLLVKDDYPCSAPTALFSSTDQTRWIPEAQAVRTRFESRLRRARRPVTVCKMVHMWHDCCVDVETIYSAKAP